MRYLGIKLNYENETLSEQSEKLLAQYYCRDNEDSQMAFARAAKAYSGGDDELAQRMYDYASKGWLMFSSPILSNAPLSGETPKAMPISCFLTFVQDTLEGLIDHSSELRWLSVKGGGVGGHWSEVRSVSEKSPGPIPFLQTVNSDMTAYRQGHTRKGSYAAYMDICHPDIIEFINMRIPSGDFNRKCLNLHHAVNITDAFMSAVYNDFDWDLIDPNDKTVRETVKARRIWELLLETRYRTGEPYLHFIDTSNRELPLPMKKKGLRINGSNLCIEVMQPTNIHRTAVCCLLSLNVEKRDEWKNSPIVGDAVHFLDNVLTAFIRTAPRDTMEKAIFAASQERSIGLGTMGFHSYLQKKGIAFESNEAAALNGKIYCDILLNAAARSYQLGEKLGEAPDMKGTGRRNAMLLAIAPNSNSSSLLATSPSIEPWKANAFTHRTRVGSHLIKNKYLEQALEAHHQNTDEVWTSIITNGGSVQHLDFLTAKEKEIFKTAIEIDQRWVVKHASDRQQFICQGQSLNLFFPANTSKKYLHDIHFMAWQSGCKGLYYLRTEASNKAEKVSEKVEQHTDILLAGTSQEECEACQG